MAGSMSAKSVKRRTRLAARQLKKPDCQDGNRLFPDTERSATHACFVDFLSAADHSFGAPHMKKSRAAQIRKPSVV
jgi:hypothetical protein